MRETSRIYYVGYIIMYICRKKAVLISNLPAIAGAVLSAVCVRMQLPELLLIGRLLTGINCGKRFGDLVSLSDLIVIRRETIGLGKPIVHTLVH